MKAEFTLDHQAELASWKIWRHFVRLRAAEAASASVSIEPDEANKIWESYCRSQKTNFNGRMTVPLEFSGLPAEHLKPAVLRDARIEKWKREFFGPAVAGHFAKRKSALDRVVYSMIRVDSPGLARELSFRITEGEAGLCELAREYSAGEERHTGGIMGPVELGTVHPGFAVALRSASPGELIGPLEISEWFVVARVEAHLPAELDEAMHGRMLDELAALWIEERTNGKPQD